jgi:hypothetical protein
MWLSFLLAAIDPTTILDRLLCLKARSFRANYAMICHGARHCDAIKTMIGSGRCLKDGCVLESWSRLRRDAAIMGKAKGDYSILTSI